jgi:hypothetical protein
VGIVLLPREVKAESKAEPEMLIPVDITFNAQRGRGFFIINEPW